MTDPLEHRVIRLEDGVDRLGSSLAEHSAKIDTKLDGIAILLTSLVRVEERQAMTNSKLSDGAKTMQDHEERLQSIEVAMPGLKEKTNWIVMAMLGVIAAVAGRLFGKF